MVIRRTAYARAGLAGNPSDGYHGRTLSTVIQNYRATATVSPAEALRVDAGAQEEGLQFADLSALVAHIGFHGYPVAHRLAIASLKRFHEYVQSHAVGAGEGRFCVQYESDIPFQVGFGGSSAIVIAILRALFDFHRIEIPQPVLPAIALDVETRELGVTAGLQDRVVQVYGGCVYMDFDADRLERDGHGMYEPIDPAYLPPLFVAHRRNASDASDATHRDLRDRWTRGDPTVRRAMTDFAELATAFRAALIAGDRSAMKQIMNENYDLRSAICPIRPGDAELVRVARAAGASAKFCGSGGAIVGIHDDERMYEAVADAMHKIGACILKPTLGGSGDTLRRDGRP
jgi:glucuronokinase